VFLGFAQFLDAEGKTMAVFEDGLTNRAWAGTPGMQCNLWPGIIESNPPNSVVCRLMYYPETVSSPGSVGVAQGSRTGRAGKHCLQQVDAKIDQSATMHSVSIL
jgi:hypothetical protein